jgi:uncharacterized membrane protein
MSTPDLAAIEPSAPADAASPVPAVERGRMRTLGPVLAFDVIGPIAVYYALASAGMPAVAALILSGAVPAAGIAIGVARERRLDAIGVLVLTGIVVGSVLGMVSGSAHLVLLDGVVPTAIFGIVCLASLRSRRPMIFRFALEGMGRDTARGREFADRWRYPGFRRSFRVVTMVWGIMFIAEAAIQAVIVQTASVSIAKTTSNLLILPFAAAVIAWNIRYAKKGQRNGALADEARRARGEAPPPMPT